MRLDDHDTTAERQSNREEDVPGHHEQTVTDKNAAIAANSVSRPPITGDQSHQVHRERQLPPGLFDHGESQRLRDRWTQLQHSFVDEPHRAVKEADAFVAEVMKRITDGFANERTGLEQQWDRGDKVSTEDLRVALQRYHAFFDRLLSV